MREYVVERIKYMAVRAWQNDKTKHELNCGNPDCDSVYALVPQMGEDGEGPFTVLICDDCGREQTFVPDPVIDNYLTRSSFLR